MPRTVFGGQQGSARRESKSPSPPSPVIVTVEEFLLLTKKELVALAGEMGVTVAPKATKAVIADAIVANN